MPARGERISPLGRTPAQDAVHNLPLYLSRARDFRAESLVAVWIIREAELAGQPCQLRYAEWGRALKCSPRWAMIVLQQLERQGWLEITRRFGQTANLYRAGRKLRPILQRAKREEGRG